MGTLNSYHYYNNISAKTRLLNFFRKLLAHPFTDGLLAKAMRPRLSRFFIHKLIPPEYLYKKPSWRDHNKNGIKMKLDISNLVDHFTYFSFEHPAITSFTNLLKNKNTVIDIGANIGYTTLLFSKACYSGKVISVEPSKELFATLLNHLNLNNASNVTPLNIGLGEEEKTVNLYKVNESNSGMNRILDPKNTQLPSESISIKTLDQLAAELPIENIDAIKIDVEGYEYNVLKGARETLKTKQPILLIEIDDFNLKEHQSSQKQVFQFLSELNYSIFMADTMQPADPLKDYSDSHFDILCFPKTT